MTQTILLADDSVTIQKVVELTFMDEDYQVVSVSNGNDAVAKLGEEKPDLVIADVHMPGANGYEVCRQAKAMLPDLPVLLLVGTFEAFNQEEAQSCGAAGYLKKPFDSQDLLRQVGELLATNEPPPEAAAPPPVGNVASGPLSLEAVGFQPEAPPQPIADNSGFSVGSLDIPDLPPLQGVGEPDGAGPFLTPEPSPPQEPPLIPATEGLIPEPSLAEQPLAPSLNELGAATQPSQPGQEWTSESSTAASEPWTPSPPPASLETAAPSPSLSSSGLPPQPDPSHPTQSPTQPLESPAESTVSPPSQPLGTVGGAAATPGSTGESAGSGASSGNNLLSEAQVEQIARRVAELIGDTVVREVAWEIIPDLAEVIIRDRLRELENQVEKS